MRISVITMCLNAGKTIGDCDGVALIGPPLMRVGGW